MGAPGTAGGSHTLLLHHNILAEHLSAGLCNAQIGLGVRIRRLYIDDHEVVAPEVPDKPRRRVDHKAGTADEASSEAAASSVAGAASSEAAAALPVYDADVLKIGRASCRERVFPLV